MNINCNIIELGDISVDVIHKDIKNVALECTSSRRQSDNLGTSANGSRNYPTFWHLKIGWIRKQKIKLKNQKRETPREYVTRESHYYLGQRFLMKVIEQNAAPQVVLKHNTLELYVRKDSYY